MIIDIRRAIESLVPNAKWDYSVPNEGGTEAQYNAIRWTDERSKPAWGEIVSTAEGFVAADLQATRQGMTCSPLQMRRALRQAGMYEDVVAWVATQEEAVSEAWEYATFFYRLDPFILVAGPGLGKTEEELDALFTLAMSL